jgi:hypothetical protein
MEFVHTIKKGDSNNNGSVRNPDKIIQMRVAADVEKKPKAAKKPAKKAPKKVTKKAPKKSPKKAEK